MSRHHRRTPNRAWERIRRRVFERDEHRCKRCGRAGRLEAHHVVSLAAGGTNDISNLRTLCRGCHIAIHRPVDNGPKGEWAKMIEGLV